MGAYAVGMQDSYTPAITHNSQMYGVEIHANIIEALLEGKTQTPLPPLLYALAAAMLCGVFFVAACKLKMLPTGIIFVLLAALDVVFARAMYRQGSIVPVILLPIVLAVIFLARVIQGYLTEIMRRRRVVNVLDRKSVV